jgi:hypothetical protein
VFYAACCRVVFGLSSGGALLPASDHLPSARSLRALTTLATLPWRT